MLSEAKSQLNTAIWILATPDTETLPSKRKYLLDKGATVTFHVRYGMASTKDTADNIGTKETQQKK